MEAQCVGTVIFKLKNDDGVVHKVKIKDTLYVPKIYRCLLSPQHAAQDLEKESGTTCETQCGLNCALVMCGLKKIISNDGRANVPNMRSAPGYKQCRVS